MTLIFRNRTIFWDIPKWNRGQTKWDGGSRTFIERFSRKAHAFNVVLIDIGNWNIRGLMMNHLLELLLRGLV